MLRFTTVGLLLAQALVTSPVLAQNQVSKPGESAARSEYKVAFWYDRNQPVSTFRYQIYDLGKKQFDPQTVGRWLELIQSRFPDHKAFLKEFSIAQGAGKDEQAVLLEKIEQEKQIVVERYRRALSNEVYRPTNFGRLMHPSISGYNPARSTKRYSFGSPVGGSSGTDYGPSSPTYPTPYPYPRPHP
ncbi:hypothetical protein V5E97_00160 [Singulisphaera sp. Ch08]|uniref:Uncharacterized protein n=1 Tax=Singulisphaera sp. Ch08 TaxID=3120278 RepID=A0AAU7CGU2_9BACT